MADGLFTAFLKVTGLGLSEQAVLSVWVLCLKKEANRNKVSNCLKFRM